MSYAIDAALRAKILEVPGVSDLIGDRLYSEQAPMNPTSPYAVLSMSDSASHRTLGGAMKSANARFSCAVWATTRDGASTIAGLISARSADDGIDGFRGTMGYGDAAVFAQCVTVTNRSHGSFAPQSGEESYLYLAQFDISIFHNL